MPETGILTTDTYPNTYEGVSDAEVKRPKGEGAALLESYRTMVNIADVLGSDELARIGDQVDREYKIDKQSRAEWETRCDRAMKLAMQVAKTKQYPWPDASNVKFPLLTTAAIQFAARAYPAIVQGKNVVKGKVLGNDAGIPIIDQQTGEPFLDESGQPVWQVNPGAKRERADRIARHMSWQLTDEMTEWEEETDRLLIILPIVGCDFRKSTFDPLVGRNRSERVSAKDLVVNYKARSIETAPRITQEFILYPHEIIERQRMGIYRDVELGRPQGHASTEGYGDGQGGGNTGGQDDDAPHQFLEQHRMLDLDGDGYPEPYIVTVHKDTRTVLRIVARFDEDGVKTNRKGEIVKIDPVHFFTKYPFLPSPDGGFYEMGFGTLVEPLNEAVNSSLNQLLDAGHLANAGGGFIGEGTRIKSGDNRFRPGEWKKVPTGGGLLKDNIVPLPIKEPSIVLFNLLGLLVDAGKEITATKDILTGEQGHVEPATTTLARLEQGLKVFTAIWKRVFRAEKAELQKLFRLNRLYLDPETYFAFNDEPEPIGPEDYEDKDLDVQPVADPGVVTDMQKLAKAEFLMQFVSDPYFDPREIRMRLLDAASIEDIEKLLIEGQPPTPPEIAEKADQLDIDKRRLELDTTETEAKITEIFWRTVKLRADALLSIAKAEAEEIGPDLEIYKSELTALTEEIKARSAANGTNAGGNGQLAQQPDNPEGLSVPTG